MKKFLIVASLVVAGCTEMGMQVEPVPVDGAVAASGAAPPPPPTARSVEDFDTTTDAQRVAAASPTTGGTLLGTTVASLGDATEPGFWIRTPLAKAVGTGRLVYPETGKSVEVELRPTESGSSRVSLAALRVLQAPLTGLPMLEVYAK
ncbi:MAG: hypothetical protein HKN98_03185 [Silicimonas sp.]|nr:hypothetical protein [Silicimonas sp.]